MTSVYRRMSFGSFKNVTNKMCLQIMYIWYIEREDFALNNQWWLIYHKTQTNQIIYI